MFGLNLFVYPDVEMGPLGMVNAGIIVMLLTRISVGFGWYGMFKKAGIPGWRAFVPLVGSYHAWRLAYDDFSFAAIFASVTFVAAIGVMGVVHPVVTACTIASLIMWWVMALLTAVAFDCHILYGFIYGALPWAGALIFGWAGGLVYAHPWSSDPNKPKGPKKPTKAEKRAELRKHQEEVEQEKRERNQAAQQQSKQRYKKRKKR